MQPATLQENVTVTAEAPLVNVTQTSPSGNIDPKQFSELPAEGQNWMALLLVAPGSRTTSVNQNAPIPMRGGGGDQQFFQTNVDGQQVSNELGGGRQPLMSQEVISELQFVSNRFDATQGRSLGVQVNVITKSGTNRYSGSVRGNFRDSDIGYAEDPLAGKVVPFKDQQISSSFGGPIVKDKLHFFVYQAYDHNPSTGVWTTPYPKFNVSKDGLLTTKQGGIRFDYQVSSQMRFMAKGDLWRNWDDGLTGGSNYPSSAATDARNGQHVELPAHARPQQPDGQRDEGRATTATSTGTPAGPSGTTPGTRTTGRTAGAGMRTGDHVHRAFRSVATRVIRVTAARIATGCVTTSRCRTTRTDDTICAPVANSSITPR
jgi:hypothetical protein